MSNHRAQKSMEKVSFLAEGIVSILQKKHESDSFSSPQSSLKFDHHLAEIKRIMTHDDIKTISQASTVIHKYLAPHEVDQAMNNWKNSLKAPVASVVPAPNNIESITLSEPAALSMSAKVIGPGCDV